MPWNYKHFSCQILFVLIIIEKVQNPDMTGSALHWVPHYCCNCDLCWLSEAPGDSREWRNSIIFITDFAFQKTFSVTQKCWEMCDAKQTRVLDYMLTFGFSGSVWISILNSVRPPTCQMQSTCSLAAFNDPWVLMKMVGVWYPEIDCCPVPTVPTLEKKMKMDARK